MIPITKEFAIDYLLDDCQDCPENKDGECMTESHCFEVKQMAIKALRQPTVCDIDAIRAEIKEFLDTQEQYDAGLKKALEIIDKYTKGDNE